MALRLALVVVALVAAACGTAAEPEPPEITRALLPPAPPQTTTTTTVPVNPVVADQLAQDQLLEVREVAAGLRSERGTFDGLAPDIDRLLPAVNIISLEEAALEPGVVYDASDERVALFVHSESGTWFCVEVSPAGDDFGAGDDFPQALTACTDNAQGLDWGNPFSPDGQDEAAIEATLRSLASSMAEGEVAIAAAAFAADPACADLAELWVDGLILSDTDELAIASIAIAGDEAAVQASLGTFAHSDWELTRGESGWKVAADPCLLLEETVIDRMTTSATELMETGLHALRSAFVVQEGFDFGASTVATFDTDLQFASADEVGFGTLYYRGTKSAGVLVTGGPPGTFYCAVESLSAATVYGTAERADQLTSPTRCRNRSG